MKETSIQQQLQTLTYQINKLQKHKKKVDAFMNLDVEEAIIDAVQGHVVNEVKNQFQTFVLTELEAIVCQKLEGMILRILKSHPINFITRPLSLTANLTITKMKLKMLNTMSKDPSFTEDEVDLQVYNALLDVIARDEIKARKDTCKHDTL
nr:hypothetical protein [Tanacetum cinerariifolium]